MLQYQKKTITVQWAKAEMLHHEGKVGTHALLTQLLYIIYKRERQRAQKWAQKQQEAHAGAATTREAKITGARQ